MLRPGIPRALWTASTPSPSLISHQPITMLLSGKITARDSNSSSARWQRRQWHPTPVLSPGKSHGWRSLVGCSPWGPQESDTTERLHFHFALSCIGEGNGNPLQCSCQENPRDGGAWWAGVYGVPQSRTWLKWLTCSSSTRRKSSSHTCPLSSSMRSISPRCIRLDRKGVRVHLCRQHTAASTVDVQSASVLENK